MPRESAVTRHMRGKSQSRPIDALIAELAERQHGVVARRQLIELGLGEGAIDRRLRLGRMHRLHSGVYTIGHRLVSRQGRWLGAVLACGPGVVLSHRSAAALWGIRGPWSGSIEVASPRSTRSRPGIRRHAVSLPGDEVTVECAIPVTTVPRTLFDLASVLPIDGVEKAMREAEYLRLYDRLSLHDLLVRRRGCRGAQTIRACLARRSELPVGRTRSPLEDRFAAFLDRAGLLRPQINPWVRVGERSFQVDCLWPAQRLIVELDGRAAHATDLAFERDRERDRLLQVAGYRVTRITGRQLRDEPEAVATDLRKLLRGRS